MARDIITYLKTCLAFTLFMEEVKFSAANPFVRVCDMNACCILGPSESPEAAVGRSQV